MYSNLDLDLCIYDITSPLCSLAASHSFSLPSPHSHSLTPSEMQLRHPESHPFTLADLEQLDSQLIAQGGSVYCCAAASCA